MAKGIGKGSKGSKSNKIGKKVTKAAKAAKKEAKKASKKKAGLKKEFLSLRLQNYLSIPADSTGMLTLRGNLSRHELSEVQLIEDKLGPFIFGFYAEPRGQESILVPLSDMISFVIRPGAPLTKDDVDEKPASETETIGEQDAD